MHGRDKSRPLTRDELRRPFEGELAARFPPVVSPEQLSQLLGYSCSTIYEWIAKGRFSGSFRKRGKHVRFWRDRALEIFFNGTDWGEEPTHAN